MALDSIEERAPAAADSTGLTSPALKALGVDLGGMYQAGKAQYDRGVEGAKSARSANAATIAPLAAGMEETRKAASAEPIPAQEAPPKFDHPGLSPEQMQDLTQTLFAFAALGGAMTRQPMTAALNAFNNGLQGMIKGDQMLFQRSAQEFDRNMKSAIMKSQQASERYRNIMEKYKMDTEMRNSQLRLAAVEMNDGVMLADLDMKGGSNAMNHALNLAKMDSEAETRRQSVAAMAAHRNAMVEQAKLTRETADARAEADRESREYIATLNADSREAVAANRTDKPPTDAERKATLFYQQMNSAGGEIDKILADGFSDESVGGQAGARMANSDWLNWLAPAEAQRYAQSTEQWAEAYLRLKTGAATNRDEIRRNARSFFPQIGDKPAVVDQKSRMRTEAEQSVKGVAGRGLAASAASGARPAAPPPPPDGFSPI